ncbi:MAG: hypothetical protein AAFZ65_13370, partial [Planctomycetota bacterium]
FGTLLVNPTTFASFAAPTAQGAPVTVPIPLPDNPALAGVAFQLQGFYVTPLLLARLTQAVDFTIGVTE